MAIPEEATVTRLRLAAAGDAHYDKHSGGSLQEVFAQASEAADVLLLCGDLTAYGLPAEAELLARDLQASVRIPILGVLGNHDFEAGQSEEICEVMERAGVTMLDGETAEIRGIGFAGVRGFGGGFDNHAVSAWGEPAIKQFVQESIDEALKLEAALSRLDTEHRVVLLHYAPIRTTVEGEPPEIFPFLGSSRLEDTLNHFEATVAFHGHAHHGTPEGSTSRGIPVYNVSIPMLRHTYPDQPPFRTIEIDLP